MDAGGNAGVKNAKPHYNRSQLVGVIANLVSARLQAARHRRQQSHGRALRLGHIKIKADRTDRSRSVTDLTHRAPRVRATSMRPEAG